MKQGISSPPKKTHKVPHRFGDIPFTFFDLAATSRTTPIAKVARNGSITSLATKAAVNLPEN
jgi:hypothetical protein